LKRSLKTTKTRRNSTADCENPASQATVHLLIAARQAILRPVVRRSNPLEENEHQARKVP
jgi:hypothetical protein